MKVIRSLNKNQLELVLAEINAYGGLAGGSVPGVNLGGGVHVDTATKGFTENIAQLLEDADTPGEWLIVIEALRDFYEMYWQVAQAAVVGGTATAVQTWVVANLPSSADGLEDWVS
jgi:hypothetical protein